MLALCLQLSAFVWVLVQPSDFGSVLVQPSISYFMLQKQSEKIRFDFPVQPKLVLTGPTNDGPIQQANDEKMSLLPLLVTELFPWWPIWVYGEATPTSDICRLSYGPVGTESWGKVRNGFAFSCWSNTLAAWMPSVGPQSCSDCPCCVCSSSTVM